MAQAATKRFYFARNSGVAHQANLSSAKLKTFIVAGAGVAAAGYSFALSQPMHQRSDSNPVPVSFAALAPPALLSSGQSLPRYPSASTVAHRNTDPTPSVGAFELATRSQRTANEAGDLVASHEKLKARPGPRSTLPHAARQLEFDPAHQDTSMYDVKPPAVAHRDCAPANTVCRSGSAVIENAVSAQAVLPSASLADASPAALARQQSTGGEMSRSPDLANGGETVRLDLAPIIQLKPLDVAAIIPPLVVQNVDVGAIEMPSTIIADVALQAASPADARHQDRQTLALHAPGVSKPQRLAVDRQDAGPLTKPSITPAKLLPATPKTLPFGGKERAEGARLKTDAQTRPSITASNQVRPQLVGRTNFAASSLGASQTIARPRQTARGIEFSVPTQINGRTGGSLALLIGGADEQHPQYASDQISVRLMDLLGLLRSRIQPEIFNKLSASRNAQIYVTLNELRSMGVAVSFADDDSLIIKAAMHR